MQNKHFAESPHNPPHHSSIKMLSLYFKGFFNHKILYVESFFFLLKTEKVLLRHLEDRNLGRREYDRIKLGKKICWEIKPTSALHPGVLVLGTPWGRPWVSIPSPALISTKQGDLTTKD